MRGILAITYLPVSQFAQNDTTNNETARLSLIGILSPDSLVLESSTECRRFSVKISVLPALLHSANSAARVMGNGGLTNDIAVPGDCEM